LTAIRYSDILNVLDGRYQLSKSLIRLIIAYFLHFVNTFQPLFHYFFETCQQHFIRTHRLCTIKLVLNNKKNITMSTKKHYVDNAKFLAAIIEHKRKCEEATRLGKEPPRLSNYIGHCIMQIAEGVARRPNFANYTYRDEMIGDAIENCIKYFNSFNPEKYDNPFAYFSQNCTYTFIRRLKEEKKQANLRSEIIKNTGIMHQFADLQSHDDNTGFEHEMQQYLKNFIKEEPVPDEGFDTPAPVKHIKGGGKKSPLDDFFEEEV
jgi:hypothetical protein